MEFLDKIINFIKKIFHKETLKMLDESQVKFVECDDTEFMKNIKVDINHKNAQTMVETLICHGDGLGIQNKITA